MNLRALKPSLPFLITLLLAATVIARPPGMPSIKDMKQIADPDFDASVERPAFTGKHPVLLFDEGYDNRQLTLNMMHWLSGLID